MLGFYPLGGAPLADDGVFALDANASGAFATVTLAALSAAAQGGASAAAGPGTISVATIVGTATGGGAAAGAFGTISVIAPIVFAAGSSIASGAAGVIVFVAPSAGAVGEAMALGAVGSLTLAAPLATAAGEGSVAVAIGTVTASAPDASATGGADASGFLIAVALTAPSALAEGGGEFDIPPAYRIAILRLRPRCAALEPIVRRLALLPLSRIIRLETSEMTVRWPTRDINEILDYGIDWARRLDTGETIATSEFTRVAGDAVIDRQDVTGSVSIVWLRGGSAGVDSHFTCTITTSSGRQFREDAKVPSVDRGG